MINRTIAPPYHPINHVDFIHADKKQLSNGIEVYTVNAGSQELVRFELIFKAGMYYQPKVLIASSANNLIETGSKNYTADEVSERIDYYGGFLELTTGQDYASITLYTLNKYINETFKVIEDIVKYPTFPQNEFDIYINNKKQKHLVNSQKVSVLVRRRFNELLFGENHPYGFEVSDKDFDEINVSAVKDFFNKHYHSGNCTIVVAGNIPTDLFDKMNELFGKDKWGSNQTINEQKFEIKSDEERFHLVKKDDAIQSAIRIGRILFNKTHPDYFNFQVLNTILGGYFGSRLMANIREDKGYTYGIGSGLTSLLNGGYFYISTEVGADVTQKALDEIYKEINILRTDLISEEELTTVKNYILGQLLRSIDGPFALADKFKNAWMFGLDYTYYDNYFNAIQNVTSNQLRDIANKYLQEKDLIECVAGKK